MAVLAVDGRATVVVAIVVLFVGKWLNRHVRLLRTYNISEPVTGGLLASCLFGLGHGLFEVDLAFDLALRDELLIMFFTTVGLSARLQTLLKGGRQLAVLLVLAVAYLFLQSGTGVLVASLCGLDPLIGVLGGSVSLSGGHGTAIAWAPIFEEQHGVAGAAEFGIACATFGLVIGGVTGGPLAHRLISRHNLRSEESAILSVGIEQHSSDSVPVDYEQMLMTILIMSITIGVGLGLDGALEAAGAQLPTFVACLFAGIVVTNLAPLLPQNRKLPQPEQSRSLALIADISLGLFLAISLMSLDLWTLSDLGVSVLLILVAQVVVAQLWSAFVVFRAMGSNYDAAVIASGYVGLSLGATPTAIANMTAVTTLYGPSPRAFIIVPLIGAFFIDIVNSVVIQSFVRVLSTGG
ncbi:MAG: sodium/glutamate symporter [Planctomycetota bacterium]